jgi:hypothetical protein
LESGTDKVVIDTIDSFVKNQGIKKVDLIKMDIEGAEWDVLKSRKCTRLRDCRFLIIEVHENEGQGIEAFEKAVQPFGLSRVQIRNSGAEDVFLFSNETLNRSANLKN